MARGGPPQPPRHCTKEGSLPTIHNRPCLTVRNLSPLASMRHGRDGHMLIPLGHLLRHALHDQSLPLRIGIARRLRVWFLRQHRTPRIVGTRLTHGPPPVTLIPIFDVVPAIFGIKSGVANTALATGFVIFPITMCCWVFFQSLAPYAGVWIARALAGAGVWRRAFPC